MKKLVLEFPLGLPSGTKITVRGKKIKKDVKVTGGNRIGMGFRAPTPVSTDDQ